MAASFTVDLSRSAPHRIRQSREPVDHQSLGNQEEYRRLDDGQLARLRNNPEGNNERCCSRRRMTGIEKNHEGACRRERKRRGEDPGPENSRMLSEWNGSGAGRNESRITAEEADRMAKDGISRA